MRRWSGSVLCRRPERQTGVSITRYKVANPLWKLSLPYDMLRLVLSGLGDVR